MTPREEFRALALQHGLRHPDMVELAEAGGLVRDIDTKAGREESVRRFIAAKPHLFGSDHGAKTILEAMNHFGSDGREMSDAQANAIEMAVLTKHIAAYGVKPPAPEKPVRDMSVAEAAEFENKLIAHHIRAAAGRSQRAQLRQRLGAFMDEGRHG